MPDQPQRRPGELIFLVALLVVAGLAVAEAQRLGGFARLSGPGFFPMLAALAMVASLLVAIWRRLRAGEPFGALRRFVHEVLPLRLAVVTLLMAAYVLVMPELGFMVATGLFLMSTLLYLWRSGFWASLAVTGVSLVAIQVIFRLLFQVVLPTGRLWPAGLF